MIFASFGTFTAATPTGIKRFNAQVCQNVVGLWLKYGAKPLKKQGLAPTQDSRSDATIC
jgi:hypothetical protein